MRSEDRFLSSDSFFRSSHFVNTVLSQSGSVFQFDDTLEAVKSGVKYSTCGKDVSSLGSEDTQSSPDTTVTAQECSVLEYRCNS